MSKFNYFFLKMFTNPLTRPTPRATVTAAAHKAIGDNIIINKVSNIVLNPPALAAIITNGILLFLASLSH